jgi:hypothetical protein
MKKVCFWSIAIVATLGLLGLPLEYLSGTPVPDNEAAQLVGGDYCYILVNAACVTTGCNMGCYKNNGTTTSGDYIYSESQCGQGTDCKWMWDSDPGCMIVTTATVAPPGP